MRKGSAGAHSSATPLLEDAVRHAVMPASLLARIARCSDAVLDNTALAVSLFEQRAYSAVGSCGGQGHPSPPPLQHVINLIEHVL